MWVLAAIFAVSMSWASVCSAMCAAGICPTELSHSADPDGCGQMPMGHSGSRNQAPDHCLMHHHPNTNVVKANTPSEFQLAAISFGIAPHAPAELPFLFALGEKFLRSSRSGLAPPLLSSSSLHSRLAILRI